MMPRGPESDGEVAARCLTPRPRGTRRHRGSDARHALLTFRDGIAGHHCAVIFSILHPAQWLMAILEAFDVALIDLNGEDITDLERHEGFAGQQ